MKAICISGRAGSGKDTVARVLKDKLEEQGQEVLITHMADLLKFLCSSLFGWDGQKDGAGRSLLQYVGTDIVRKRRPDFWVDFLIDVFDLFGDNWDYVLIPDCRFPNEISRLKDVGYPVRHIHVERSGLSPLTKEQRLHASETSMDMVSPDYVLYNNGTIDDLYRNIAIEVSGADTDCDRKSF